MPPFTLPACSACLVALSGGADSSLLLELTVRALLERCPEARVGETVTAVHLHHGIRGEEADRDLEFCQALCDRLDVPLIIERADIPAMAKASGESMETAARRVRYELFHRVMIERGIPVLLTAHHADDNLETVLERLLRGSGTKGMGGIPPSRELGVTSDGMTLTVHRPLLGWTKREILEACEKLGLKFVTDSTNLVSDHTRNRLRNTVIPALEEVAGEGIPQRTAARLTRAAREDEDCLMGLSEAQADRYRSPDGDGLLLEGLQSHYAAISKRMMLTLYERVTAQKNPRDGSGTLNAAHIEALYELIQKGIPESSVSLPRGMEARIRGDWLYIRPTECHAPLTPADPIPLPLGCTPWGEGITVLIEASPTPLFPADGGDVWASAVFPAGLPLPLLARTREAGDTILSHGMHKKLKKILCDQNIPPHLRDRIPLICLPDGSPLWYPTAVFRDGFPPPSSGPCLRVTVFIEKT